MTDAILQATWRAYMQTASGVKYECAHPMRGHQSAEEAVRQGQRDLSDVKTDTELDRLYNVPQKNKINERHRWMDPGRVVKKGAQDQHYDCYTRRGDLSMGQLQDRCTAHPYIVASSMQANSNKLKNTDATCHESEWNLQFDTTDHDVIQCGYTRHKNRLDYQKKQITHVWISFAPTTVSTDARRRRLVDLLLNLSGFYSWFGMGEVRHVEYYYRQVQATTSSAASGASAALALDQPSPATVPPAVADETIIANPAINHACNVPLSAPEQAAEQANQCAVLPQHEHLRSGRSQRRSSLRAAPRQPVGPRHLFQRHYRPRCRQAHLPCLAVQSAMRLCRGQGRQSRLPRHSTQRQSSASQWRHQRDRAIPSGTSRSRASQWSTSNGASTQGRLAQSSQSSGSQ